MKNEVNVSVVIATYKRHGVLVETIKSVLKQEFKGYELIIVDQTKNHDRKTEKFLNNLPFEKVRYYKVFPPSLPAARNFGLKKAKGDIIIYIDDDVLLDQGFIEAHADSYQQRDVVCVAGRVVQKDKPITDTLLYFRKTGFGAGSLNYPKFAYAETALGCNMSYKKEVLLRIGGFDTNFIGNAIGEESDVSFKLKKQGYKILFSPNASLFHLFYQSGGCREKKSIYDNYIVYRNEMIFFLRHRPLIYFSYFLAGHFFKYVLNRKLINQGKVLSRLRVFLFGLLIGSWIFFFPKKKIIAREVTIA